MKKLQAVMLTLVAALAFGAITVASASAETTKVHEWLAKGVVIKESLTSQTLGELLLEDAETLIGKAAVVCNGILEGTVGESGEGTITKVLNAAGTVEVGSPLSGTPLECKTETGCAAATIESPINVWPVGLPWKTILFLNEANEVLNLIEGPTAGAKFGFELLCLILGVNTVDECTSTDSNIKVVNNASGDASTPINSLVTPNVECTQSKKLSGVEQTATEVLIQLVNGELLSIE
jgi:hypothetical protein